MFFFYLNNVQLSRKDTDKVVKTQQSSDDLLVCFHDDVNPGADTFVHQL